MFMDGITATERVYFNHVRLSRGKQLTTENTGSRIGFMFAVMADRMAGFTVQDEVTTGYTSSTQKI